MLYVRNEREIYNTDISRELHIRQLTHYNPNY